MQTYAIDLAPGQTLTTSAAGLRFQVLSGSLLDIDIMLGGRTVYPAKGVSLGMWAKPEQGFDAIRIKNTLASAQTVQFFTTMGDAGYDQPIGALTLSGTIDARDVKDTALTHLAAVSVGAAATLIAGADATRRGLRLFNAGAADVYLGGPGVTVANGAMKLPPGGYLEEMQAPGAAWYGISPSAGQSVRVMELRA